MSKSLVIAFSLSLGVLPVIAADYTMTVNDASGKSGFSDFDVSGKALGTPTAENNYYLGGKTMRTPNAATATFPGKSLHINASGRLALPRSAGYTQKVIVQNDGLFLDKGHITPYAAGVQLALECPVTVQGTKEDDVYIGTVDKNHYSFTNNFTGTLYGEKDAWLTYRAVSTNNFAYLHSGKMANYKGTLKLGIVGGNNVPLVAEYRNGFVLPGRLIVSTGSYLYPQYGTSHGTLGGLVLKDGAIIGARSGSNDYATLTVTNNVDVGKDIEFRYASTLNVGSAYSVPFLVKGKDAAGDLNPQNFVEKTRNPTATECLPRCWFETTANADGGETLWFRQNKVVQLKAGDSAPAGGDAYSEGDFASSSLTNSIKYQDGKLPQSAVDYVVTRKGFAGNNSGSYTGYRLFTPQNKDLPNGEYAFAGASLTIGTNVTFRSAATTLRIKSLRLMGNSYFCPRVNVPTASSLEGEELFVGTESAGRGARVVTYCNLVWTVKPKLTGSGLISFQANEGSSNPAGTVVLTGLSTNFTGRIAVTAGSLNEKLGASVNECLRVSDGRQLGGPLAAFTANALVLENWGTLEATDDVNFNTANRGVTVGNYGQIRVASGKTLTLGNRVTCDGELHKAGDGCLTFGEAAEAGAGAKLVVDRGTVRAAVSAALAGVDVAFADGTALVVDTTKDLGANGIVLSSASTAVPVALAFADEDEHSLTDHPLCTVPSSVAVRVARIRRHAVRLTSRDNGDGTKTVLASVSPAGFSVFVR